MAYNSKAYSSETPDGFHYQTKVNSVTGSELINTATAKRFLRLDTTADDTIIDKIDKIGGFDLIDTKRFIKPSINWINAVRNSSLKKYHKAKLSNIPPVRGADFLYIKRGKNES